MPAGVLAVHHLSLSVTDLEASTDWYVQVLGLEVTASLEGPGFRRTRLRAPSGLTVTLTRHDQEAPGPFDERHPGLDHVALSVDREQLPTFQARLAELGVRHSEVKQSSSGNPLITFWDPDGIQLELVGVA